MKKITYYISLFSILSFLFSSCERESSNGIATYINPTKDSIKFAYRLSTLYYSDYANEETTFDFNIDTGTLYAWKSIVINYEQDSTTKRYSTEYTNGYLSKLVEEATSLQNIEIEYALLPPSNIKLISKLKYFRLANPFALVFIYDSARLARVERRYLDRLTGDIGGLTEYVNFCPNMDMGNCVDSTSTSELQYSGSFNNLYHSNELAPFIFLLNKPGQSSIKDILPDFPYYFSRHFPSSISSPISGEYEFGLNSLKEATYVYFKPYNSTSVQGYNFSMR